jgi:hypothetical protein
LPAPVADAHPYAKRVLALQQDRQNTTQFGYHSETVPPAGNTADAA